MKRYFYFYKITNNKNGKYYYGVHSTNNLNDGYMGSSVGIKRAIEKYGISSFTKEYLRFFENAEEMYKFEHDFVTIDKVKDVNCYNMTLGGKRGGTPGKVVVKDKDNNIYIVDTNDPRYKSGEFVHNTKGNAVVIGNNGKPMSISINDPNYHKYKHINLGKTIVLDESGKPKQISITDPNYRKYKHINTDKVVAKDIFGNIIRVSRNDSRLQTGELVGVTKGEITVYDNTGNKIKVKKGDPRFNTGELHGYRKDMVTVKDAEGNKLSVLKSDPRYITGELVPLYEGHIWISKNGKTKHISPDYLDEYISDGWKKGRK